MNLPQTLRKLKSDYPRLQIRVTEFSDYIWIYDLEVSYEFRNQGIGSAAIKELQKLGKTLRLDAVSMRGMEKDLERFYLRLKFKPVSVYGEMIWHP